MSEGSSGGFASFLKNSANKLSSTKGVKFLPPQTSKDGDTSEAKAKSQKEHRRAQVRKAQLEHRQRKENYTKHLEQDVIGLRDMIAAAETAAAAIKQENISIKTTLSQSNISTNITPSTNFQAPQQGISSSDFTTFQSIPETSPTNFDFQSPQNSNWPSNSSSSNVSIVFDDVIDATCLQLIAPSNFNIETLISSPDTFNFSNNNVSQLSQSTASDSTHGLQKPLPHLPCQTASIESTVLQAELSSIAINFILALEHPCRTHFHALPAEFDPTGDSTGHELMASTLLYSHAPASVFNGLDSAAWAAPSLELTQLLEMSQSLPKGDFEITPVQAWFLLSQNYEAKRLLRNLNGLKKGFGQLVGCFAFGAVMDELKFWDVVKSVMGEYAC